MRYEITAVATSSTDQVWRALVDVESWPRWMSSYTDVHKLDPGPLRAGCRARVAQPGLKESVFRVTTLREGREFTWESAMPGIRTVARHVVRPLRDGRTQIALSVTQTGPLTPVMRVLLGNRIRRFLAIEADGLVRAGEAQPRLDCCDNERSELR